MARQNHGSFIDTFFLQRLSGESCFFDVFTSKLSKSYSFYKGFFVLDVVALDPKVAQTQGRVDVLASSGAPLRLPKSGSFYKVFSSADAKMCLRLR